MDTESTIFHEFTHENLALIDAIHRLERIGYQSKEAEELVNEWIDSFESAKGGTDGTVPPSMTTKTKTILLSHPWVDTSHDTMQQNLAAPRLFRVEKVTDSIEFKPLQMLNEYTVQELCKSKEWRVTVVPPNLPRNA